MSKAMTFEGRIYGSAAVISAIAKAEEALGKLTRGSGNYIGGNDHDIIQDTIDTLARFRREIRIP